MQGYRSRVRLSAYTVCRFKSGAGADWGVRESRTAAIELTAGYCCAIGGFPCHVPVVGMCTARAVCALVSFPRVLRC